MNPGGVEEVHWMMIWLNKLSRICALFPWIHLFSGSLWNMSRWTVAFKETPPYWKWQQSPTRLLSNAHKLIQNSIEVARSSGQTCWFCWECWIKKLVLINWTDTSDKKSIIKSISTSIKLNRKAQNGTTGPNTSYSWLCVILTRITAVPVPIAMSYMKLFSNKKQLFIIF